MPLTLTLKPYEMLVINGARVINGDGQTKLTFENECRMLRGTELLPDLDPTLSINRLALSAQDLHLYGEKGEYSRVEAELQNCQEEGFLSADQYHAILALLRAGETHKAFRACRVLIQ